MAEDKIIIPKSTDRYAIVSDEHGFPMMFDVTHAEPVVEEPPAPDPPTLPAVPPEGVEPVEWQRRHDRIRDMAREFDGASEADVREYLKGVAKRDLTDDEIALIHLEVTNQRIGDLVDILDEQLRTKIEGMKRGRRRVRVQAPRGYTKKALKELTDEQAAEVLHRLENRGHSADALNDLVAKRFHESRHEAIGSAREKLAALGFSASEIEPSAHISWEDETALTPELAIEMATNTIKAFRDFATNMPAPHVNVEVPVNVERGSGKKIVKRDPDTGLIESVEEE